MQFIKTSLVLTTLLGLVAVSNQTTLANHQKIRSGLKGRIKSTVCRTNRQQTRIKCRLEAIQAEVIIKGANSDQATARLQSDENGRFKINLAPGEYRLSPGPSLSDKTIFPKRVQVFEDEFTKLMIFLNGDINLSLSS